uniref:Uncharacterized protein n=1 Tax=Leptospira santarosai serovar Arenal str. MAVJ 401 TaxID=1049976 RepID=M6JJ52_9LEPT|nr:hypothetical protein LEP1GSC063_2732 [Leptospira santarosai serovar Arenal str. MAVJ 401]
MKVIRVDRLENLIYSHRAFRPDVLFLAPFLYVRVHAVSKIPYRVSQNLNQKNQATRVQRNAL